MHTIGHAAALTGVPAATLRAWERRYGLVHPVRTDSGYRLYDERALQLLRAMGALVAAGWSPSQAAEHLRTDGTDVRGEEPRWEAYLTGDRDGELTGGAGRQDQAVARAPGDPAPSADSTRTTPSPGPTGSEALDDRPIPETTGAWDVGALARGAAALDPEAVSRAVDEAFARGSLEQVVDGWLMPALHLLGAQWRDGRVDVAGEHVVSATVHRRLAVAMEAADRPADGPRVVVGLARGSHHELGILAFAVVLRRAGVDVIYLGANLPAEHWVSVVQRYSPSAVVMGVPTATDVLAVRDAAAALHAANPLLTIHVGGGAQFEVGQGTRPLGHSLTSAARALAAALRSPATGD